MIKGLGYLKYLKQSLIGFGISCFILLGGSFVSAYYCNSDNTYCYDLQLGEYINNNGYKGAVIDKNFNFNNLIFDYWSGENRFFSYWWELDGLHYTEQSTYLSNGRNGNVFGYFSCDNRPSLSDSSLDHYCNYSNSFSGLQDKLSDDNRYLFYCRGFDSGNPIQCTVCSYNSNSVNSGNYTCLYKFSSNAITQEFLSDDEILLSATTNPYSTTNGGQFSGSSEGSVEGNLDSNITGDYVYVDCTWNDIIIALESEGYNKYVCYGGLDNFDLYDSSVNYNPIAGYGKTINQIWGWSGSRAWDNFTEWFTFWNGLYKDSSNNNYIAMWESYPAVYRTYFQLYNAYKGSMLDPRTVLEYCNIKQFTGSTLNNSAGGYFSTACQTVVREKQTGIWQSRVDGTIYSGGVYNSDVPISVNWNGVGNMSGLETQGDGLVFIQNFFNLAKSRITTNFSTNFSGVLPGYIVVFLLAIILFRFLRH